MSRRPPMRGLERPPRQLYRRPIPDLPRSFELPMYLRVALGQAAADGVPVVASLALAWVRSEPSINLRMPARSEEHTSELQSLMRISYAVFCLKKKNSQADITSTNTSKTNKPKLKSTLI